MTNFREEWSRDEILEYLDRKGEDYDDCQTLDDLIQRARECEENTGEPATKGNTVKEVEDEDALDAYMKSVDDAIQQQEDSMHKSATKTGRLKRELLETDEPGVDFLEQVALHPDTSAAALPADGGDGDKHGGSMSLKPIDHGSIQYEDFEKNLYVQPVELAALDAREMTAKRQRLKIRVLGGGYIPCPIDTFYQAFYRDRKILRAVETAGYASPTPIQAQAIPAILAGRDVVGIAETGSGKTAAYTLPMISHIMAQTRLEKGEGPIALIISPTRELAEQIHQHTRKFGKFHGLRSCAAFGGLHKYNQIKELRAGAEIAVCTPGRMIDLIKSKACTLHRVTYVVLDEADRMFDLGFEPQIRELIGQIRPNRQFVLFSATMPRKVENLAATFLDTPVRVLVGSVGGVNANISQHVYVTNNEAEKKLWLTKRIEQFIDKGDVLIFANQKATVEDVYHYLDNLGQFKVGMFHGGVLDQGERRDTLSRFKNQKLHVLVATDIAARGLDIDTIKVVINYDAPKDSNTYVHRIGRTSRAGKTDGEAHTLLLPHEGKQAAHIVEYMESVGQEPPPYIANLAKRHRKRKPNPTHTAIGSNSRTQEEEGGFDQAKKNTTNHSTRNFMSSFVSAGDVHGDDTRSQKSSTVTIVPPKAGPKPQIQPTVDIKVQSAIDRAKAIAESLTRQHEGSMKKKSRWDAS
ncbi:hypothetical protein M9434_002316 [Picochlorum sp. BPE23]|nr:hypothetical protein M9434_002316 [Picochlorum sp. BPE23]